MQPANTTELQAVNTMLSTIGEAPVDSLSGATSSDAAPADQVLRKSSARRLCRGGTSTSIRTTGSTATASATSSSRPTPINRIKYPTIEPVMRPQAPPSGGTLQLYDRGNQTYTFNQDLQADKVVWYLG